VSRERVAALLALLGELEGQLERNPDPQLTELRATIGAALAALYRANAEQTLVQKEVPVTRH
jgi:hypothetical protein